MNPTYTITTAKGSFAGTLRAVCDWQSEHQGARAVIACGSVEVDVDGVDFDADELSSVVSTVRALFAAEVAAR
jgi:hypothetical protein